MNHKLLESFFAGKTYDIRLTNNGRWIDQKCTLDAVSFVADCITNFVDSQGSDPFISPDIWKSVYAVKQVQSFFGKPDPLSRSTLDEYNKFFRQPMKMLSAAGVLSENKVGSSIKFTVVNRDVLEYLAVREWNSFEFLCLYIEKTLNDSGLWDAFETFFDDQTQPVLDDLKQKFTEFCIDHTAINTTLESGRIFTKVLNPLARKLDKKGIVKGRLSKTNITNDQIQYNQPNWRDILINKNKNIARSDYSETTKIVHLHSYYIRKAKETVRRYNKRHNSGNSEVVDQLSIGLPARHIHHIFPQHQYPEIADYRENLIALTVAQHYEKAHPKNNTQIVDKDYQYICLIHKTESIRKNILSSQNGEQIVYDFENFMKVLDIGFNTDYFGNLAANDFDAVVTGIGTFRLNRLA